MQTYSEKFLIFFVRTNILCRRFYKCSMAVKCILFKTYCIYLYDAALWSTYNKGSLRKLSSCYNKCVELFFGLIPAGYIIRSLVILLLLIVFDVRNFQWYCISVFYSYCRFRRWILLSTSLVLFLITNVVCHITGLYSGFQSLVCSSCVTISCLDFACVRYVDISSSSCSFCSFSFQWAMFA